MRTLNNWRRRLQLVPFIELPLDKVIVFALVTLDGSNHAVHFVKENWSDPAFGFELGDYVFAFSFGQFVLFLYVVKELAWLHVFWVWAALLHAANFIAFLIATGFSGWFWRFLLIQRRFIKVLIYLAIKVDPFIRAWFSVLVNLFRVFQDLIFFIIFKFRWLR